MASLHHSNRGSRSNTCTRTHCVAALALVVSTVLITRTFDHYMGSCSSFHLNSLSNADIRSGPDEVLGFSRYSSSKNRSNFKVYVYDEHEIGELRLLLYGRDGKISADNCAKGQWGTQVKLHRMFLQSAVRTRRKEEADFFFVPSYVKCVRMMGGLNDKEINETYVKVLSQMPYFRLSGGRNHIFVFPSGAGAHLFKSWATYINRSIILTPEGDRTDKRDSSAFNTWKDIIIPGNVEDGMTFQKPKLVDPLPLSKRKYLANYLGRAQGKAGRLQLIDLAKRFPDKMECPELKFSGPDKLGRTEYFQHLRNAKFCLAPRGESSWTLRFYESFFVECVPVLLSDQVELPFQDVVDYTQISIKWPSSRIGIQLLDYLESIPDKAIEEMISKGRRVRCIFVYASESESCSAFNGILRELEKKVRQFHQSAETFWLHNGSIVNRDLLLFRPGFGFSSSSFTRRKLLQVFNDSGKTSSMVDDSFVVRRYASEASHAIPVSSDDEALLKASKEVGFVWTQFSELYSYYKKRANDDGKLSTKIAEMVFQLTCKRSSRRQQIASNASSELEAILLRINNRVKRMYSCLPSNAMLIIVTGHGDTALIERLRSVLSKQTETAFSREKIVKVLEELQAQAEVGLCFVGIKH